MIHENFDTARARRLPFSYCSDSPLLFTSIRVEREGTSPAIEARQDMELVSLVAPRTFEVSVSDCAGDDVQQLACDSCLLDVVPDVAEHVQDVQPHALVTHSCSFKDPCSARDDRTGSQAMDQACGVPPDNWEACRSPGLRREVPGNTWSEEMFVRRGSMNTLFKACCFEDQQHQAFCILMCCNFHGMYCTAWRTVLTPR